MRWVLNLDGGPRRVNHAALAIGDKIYSFGGYAASDPLDSQSDFIDIHMLNTFSYRWEHLPVFAPLAFPRETTTKFPAKPRSATISAPGISDFVESVPSTSAAGRDFPPADVRRRRARSLTEVHPLALIRSANPPLEDDQQQQLMANNLVHRRRSTPNRCDALRFRSSRVRPAIDEEEEGNYEQIGQDEADLDDEFGSDMHSDDTENGQPSMATDADELDSEEGTEQRMETDGGEDSDDEMAEFMADNGQMEDEEEEEGDEWGEDSTEEDLFMLAKLRQHPEIPFKRYGHTVVAYHGAAYLWGGRNDKFGCNQTLHRYDPVSNRWSVVPTVGQCPPSRDGHSAVVNGDFMFIFGGFEEREHRFSQETYAFHFPTKVWKKLKTEGESPQYRDFHAACVLGGKMYVFGGRSDEMGQLHTSHDVYCDKLHCLDLKTLRWHRPEVKEPTTAPCGRRSLTMWTYREAIYIFGGYQSIRNAHFNDLWRFDPTTNRWAELLPSGQMPSPRRRQCTVLVGDRVFLFGGTMPNGERKSGLSDLGDLFVLDFAPSLATLCCQTVLKFGLQRHAANILPAIIMKELHYLSTPNRISKLHVPSSDNMTHG
ncbi:hypothetical protein niasHT_038020 [Heterodera trifolii]|uniref:Uncharacterized protein n=1 Tax=Heterodera trifolii TaxID=157864 RepID=A0ABD2HS24_9BILA